MLPSVNLCKFLLTIYSSDQLRSCKIHFIFSAMTQNKPNFVLDPSKEGYYLIKGYALGRKVARIYFRI
jgi:hypothetical protein